MSLFSNRKLPSGMKDRFPFCLSTTSFIYPAGWVENVARLGPYFDQIELLFFESRRAQSLPSWNTARTLARQAKELDICFNVHLPIDIRLGDESAQERRASLDVLKRVFDLVGRMPVSTHTLHLVYDDSSRSRQNVEQWRNRVHGSLLNLLEWGIPASALSVENLDYPLDWIESTLVDLDLAVCLDIGHLLKCGHDLPSALTKWADRTSIIHLHGVADGRDHLALDRLSQNYLQTIFSHLQSFCGVLSLEVFNAGALERSMNCLEQCWRTYAQRSGPL